MVTKIVPVRTVNFSIGPFCSEFWCESIRHDAVFQKMLSSQKRSHRNSVQNGPIEKFTALTGTIFVSISMFMSRGNFRAIFGQPSGNFWRIYFQRDLLLTRDLAQCVWDLLLTRSTSNESTFIEWSVVVSSGVFSYFVDGPELRNCRIYTPLGESRFVRSRSRLEVDPTRTVPNLSLKGRSRWK